MTDIESIGTLIPANLCRHASDSHGLLLFQVVETARALYNRIQALLLLFSLPVRELYKDNFNSTSRSFKSVKSLGVLESVGDISSPFSPEGAIRGRETE